MMAAEHSGCLSEVNSSFVHVYIPRALGPPRPRGGPPPGLPRPAKPAMATTVSSEMHVDIVAYLREAAFLHDLLLRFSDEQ